MKGRAKEIVDSSPKLENGSLDSQAVAEHYGLSESAAAPDTGGYGDVLADDPARSADGRRPGPAGRGQIRGAPRLARACAPTGMSSDRRRACSATG